MHTQSILAGVLLSVASLSNAEASDRNENKWQREISDIGLKLEVRVNSDIIKENSQKECEVNYSTVWDSDFRNKLSFVLMIDNLSAPSRGVVPSTPAEILTIERSPILAQYFLSVMAAPSLTRVFYETHPSINSCLFKFTASITNKLGEIEDRLIYTYSFTRIEYGKMPWDSANRPTSRDMLDLQFTSWAMAEMKNETERR